VDSSLASILITYGPLGIFVILFVFGVIVPKWYVTKLEKEIAFKDKALEIANETVKNVTAQLSFANQMVGELRTIAVARTGATQRPYELGEGQTESPGDPRGSGT
jgi:ABC-type tungstate transport system substrate-binding protein